MPTDHSDAPLAVRGFFAASLLALLIGCGFSEADDEAPPAEAERCRDEEGDHLYFVDADGDGFGTGMGTPSCAATAPEGFAANADDPNDDDASVVPHDRDGDGVENEDDCAPEDPTRYAEVVYYEDGDGDGLGEAAFTVCTFLPAPPLEGFVMQGGDTCPGIPNLAVDIDADGQDDACDSVIHFTTSMTLGDESISFARFNASGEEVEYRVGRRGDPVEIHFEGSQLTLAACVNVSIEGGSTLRFESTAWSDDAGLAIATYDLSCPGEDVESGVTGIPDPSSDSGNQIEFVAATLTVGKRAFLRGLDRVAFRPRPLLNPASNEIEDYGSGIRHLGENDFWNDDFYLTITDSPGDHAVEVIDQYLDFYRIRFIDNTGYPLACHGRHDNRAYNPANPNSGHGNIGTACGSAAGHAYFDGNLFDGPALFTVEEWVDGSFHCWGATEDSSFCPELNSGYGAREMYIQSAVLGADTGQLDVFANEMAIYPYRIIERDEGGEVVSQAIDPAALLTILGIGSERATLRLEESSVRDLPLHITGGGLSAGEDSVVGPLIVESASEGGPGVASVELFGATLDLEGSAFRIDTGLQDLESAGLVAIQHHPEREVFVGIEPWDDTSSSLISAPSIDAPMLVSTPPGATYEPTISIDEETEIEGTTFGELIEFDATSSAEPTFELN